MSPTVGTKKLAMGALALCIVALAPASAWAGRAPRPNVVVILADDLGWRDVSHHGSEIRTPHIDRIAREGVVLDRFYVQPTCSPTRAALMTGKSPIRLGIERPMGKNEREGLPLGETLLPEHLAALGYQPLMVGKWHLGNHRVEQFPHHRGFEHFYGYLCGGVGYWDHIHGGGLDWQRNGETLREEGYATRLLADEAVRVLRQRDRSRPTFLYLAFGAPHLPNEATEEALARNAGIAAPLRRVHAGMVTELDDAIGRVLETLEAEQMLSDTLVLFASDNGGLVPESSPPAFHRLVRVLKLLFDRPMPLAGLEFLVSNVEDGASDNAPLRGGKASILEGGARVPAAIWWPGHLEAGHHDGFVTISDVLPTLLDALGAASRIPPDLDGASQWAALTGEGTSATPDYLISGFDGRAIYRAPFKLVVDDPPRLYDVYADPLEQRDVAAAHPALVEELADAARAWPRGERESTSVLGFLRDPDAFGGPEDREPWADAARRRSAGAGPAGP